MSTSARLRRGDPERIGRYRVLGRLAAGGQGVVFLAAGDDGRQVAVKTLPWISDEAARHRMATELDLLRRVSGFCTAQVLDADLTHNPPHIVTEYVPGPSLDELVRSEGPLRGEALERLAVATATALTAIHRADIAHLDLTPRNVVMGPDGPRVIDFGLAHALGGATTDSPIAGTPAFIAPEQLAGHPPRTAADLFSWAATIVYAATGRPPFGDDSVQSVVYRVLHQDPDLGPDIELDGFLRSILTVCLAKDPAHRPSAQDLLYHLVDQAPMDPAGPPIRSQARKPARKRSWVIAVAAVVVIAGGGGGVVVLWKGESGSPAAQASAAPARLLPPPLYAEEAEQAARNAYGIVNSFAHQTLDKDFQAVDAVATGRANVEYTGRLQDQAQRIREEKIVRKAVPAESGIVAARPDRVAVLVWGQTTTSSGSSHDYRRGGAILEMRKVATVWKLDHVWPREPHLNSAEMTTGEWPSGLMTTLLSAASGSGARAVALETLTSAGARVFRLNADETVSRLDLVPTGRSFQVGSSRELGVS
ncbi:serine/threonine protein kinase [Nonomuraea mesophila]|uniref:non-specific serine/threonine protein kinase n=1 Tax=Nonomuraea mesophila TaxID=2530382 RepID=A0A4R5EWV3_9ACTN|nr:serine/threonine-protein kinase [Nonomuraea mesophila]TDE39498.1 serine/threonine protein kinase [Nonomuraea mesophila]